MNLEYAMMFAESLGECSLEKTNVGGAAMRTSKVEGVLLAFPRLGESLFLRAPTLDQKVKDEAIFTNGISARLVNTSPLVEVTLMPDNGGLLCLTSSGSCYVLKARHD